MPCSVLSEHLELFVPVLFLLPLISSRYNFLKKLSLIFNNHVFYKLSNIITHIWDYSKKKAYIVLDINVTKQTLTIFDLELVFMEGLIKVI